jgi:uncharacterized Zn finger protein
MLESDTEQPVRTNCPQCNARLKVLRIITGRAGSEYWTLRCIGCGGIHLDIVKTSPPLSTEAHP